MKEITGFSPPRFRARAPCGARPLLVLLVILGLGTVAPVGVAAPREASYRGRPLVDVLRELQSRGLELVYSSAVVPPDLTITIEPQSSDPVELLDELLPSLNLTLRQGPDGTLLIVPGPRTHTLEGHVVSVTGGQPVGGAQVSLRLADLRATTDSGGNFRIEEVPPGLHGLRVEAPGYSPLTVTNLRVPEDVGQGLELPLHELPALTEEVVVIPGQRSLLHEDQGTTRAIGSEDSVVVPTIGGDIARVVERLPGIAAGDNSARFHARGSLDEDTSLVLDGLELYDPYHLDSFQSPFSLIDSRVVDRAELLSGGFTADFGDRHGSFVRIATVGAESSRHGELEIGTLNSRFSFSTPFRRRGSWIVSARGWYPESLLASFEVGAGERLRPRFADLYTKLAWTFSPRLMVSAHLLAAHDQVDFQEKDEEINENVQSDSNSVYGWFRLLSAPIDRLSMQTVLSIGGVRRSRQGAAVPEDQLVFVDDRRTVDFGGVTHDLTWQFAGRHRLKSGLYLRPLRATYDYRSTESASSEGSRSLDIAPRGESLGAYVSYRALVAESLAVEAGLRWDSQNYTADQQLAPRFNLRWTPRNGTELRFAIGRFYQSQRIHELNVEDGQDEFLPAESSRQVELTFIQTLSKAMRFRLDAYYRDLDDLRPRWENLFQPVELFPEASADRVMIAPEAGRLRGVELLLSGRETRGLEWWVSYTLSSAEDRIHGQYVRRSWDQPQALKFLIAYRRIGEWFVSFSGTAHTGWPTTPVGSTAGGDPVIGPRNSTRLPNYARLDFKARRTFALRRSTLSVTLDVINLTDRRNACCVGDFFFDPDGGAAEAEFDYWLGFTPALSFLWEF